VELDEWCPVLTVNARRNMAMSKFCRQYQLLTEAEMKPLGLTTHCLIRRHLREC
jgi:hypothetical protein